MWAPILGMRVGVLFCGKECGDRGVCVTNAVVSVRSWDNSHTYCNICHQPEMVCGKKVREVRGK
jgi:hypothetical protein